MVERIVVVPWTPQALIVPRGDKAPDDVDRFVNEIFGPDVEARPGWCDAFLLVAGTAVFLWSVITEASRSLALVGIAAALLGCVLPARMVWRAIQRRAVQRRQRAAMARGLPLVADHPLTGELIVAYDRLLEVAALPGVEAFGDEATSAAHQAVIEVASLLQGLAPSGMAEEEYVVKRARSVETLARALKLHRRAQVDVEGREVTAAAEAERELDRTARLLAVEEMDARLGPDSLARLGSLVHALEAGAGDLGG